MISNYLNLIKFTYFGLWISYIMRKFTIYSLIKNKIKTKDTLENKYKIRREDGYKVLDLDDKKELHDTLNFVKKKYTIDYILTNNKTKSKQNTLNIVDVDLNDERNLPIKKLCLNEYLISAVSEYLKAVPILFNVQVWYSPNVENKDLIGSQLYHFDREDFRQIKCFIPLEDIDIDSGPLTLISSKNSKKFIFKNLLKLKLISSKGRFTDNEIKSAFKKNVELPLKCKTGQIALIDTTQCLHFGSRPSKKYKYHITIQYLSPYSTKLDSISKKFSSAKTFNDLVLVNYKN